MTDPPHDPIATPVDRRTVIRVEDRERYLRALDAASIDQRIEPFARLIAECVKRSASSGSACLAFAVRVPSS